MPSPSSYRALVGRGVFSLLELAVVLVVLGVVAVIVAPRMSRGATAASSPRLPQQLLVGHLRALRAAIHDYANDHGGHPPDGDADRAARQLTQYTDWSGATSPTRTPRHTLGPYLRDIPPIPTGPHKGAAILGLPGNPHAAWTYDPATGNIHANISE
jgi:type II secretory pathway pseudopilin PulG